MRRLHAPEAWPQPQPSCSKRPRTILVLGGRDARAPIAASWLRGFWAAGERPAIDLKHSRQQ